MGIIHSSPSLLSENNNTGKMSAIVEEPDGFYEPIKVLITLHEGMDTMDAIGPMEVFSLALHDKKVKESKAFRVIFAGKEQNTMTAQNIPIRAHIDYEEDNPYVMSRKETSFQRSQGQHELEAQQHAARERSQARQLASGWAACHHLQWHHLGH